MSIVSALRTEKPFVPSVKAIKLMVRGAKPTFFSSKSRLLKIPPTPSTATGLIGRTFSGRRSFLSKVTPVV